MTAPFFRPASIAEAVELLTRHDGARYLAGGATLVAMMNARLVEPTALVSLGGIAELGGVERREDGTVWLGAITRHVTTASSHILEDGQRLLAAAAASIANPPVRNMGTIGGSVAFADPAADYLPALSALDAELEIAGPQGARTVPVRDFVTDWYTTCLGPAEIITGVLVPPAPLRSVAVFEKLARTEGDFAICSIALVLAREGPSCRGARIAVGGCGPGPVRLREAEAILEENGIDEGAVGKAGRMLAEACDPVDDVRASADYRRRVVPRLLAKAIARSQEARVAA